MWGVTWVWSHWLTVASLLLGIWRARPTIYLISIVFNGDWLPRVTMVVRCTMIHVLGWWSRILRANFLIPGTWVRSSVWCPLLGWITVFRLKWNGRFVVGRLLPGTAHGVAFADESTSKAVITYECPQYEIKEVAMQYLICSSQGKTITAFATDGVRKTRSQGKGTHIRDVAHHISSSFYDKSYTQFWYGY